MRMGMRRERRGGVVEATEERPEMAAGVIAPIESLRSHDAMQCPGSRPPSKAFPAMPHCYSSWPPKLRPLRWPSTVARRPCG